MKKEIKPKNTGNNTATYKPNQPDTDGFTHKFGVKSTESLATVHVRECAESCDIAARIANFLCYLNTPERGCGASDNRTK